MPARCDNFLFHSSVATAFMLALGPPLKCNLRCAYFEPAATRCVVLASKLTYDVLTCMRVQ